MACNCGKKVVGPQVYVHTAPDGTTTTYASKIEAVSVTQRKGGSWSVKTTK